MDADFSCVHAAVVRANTSREELRELLDSCAAGSDTRRALPANFKDHKTSGETPLQAAHRLGRGDLVGVLLCAGARAADLFPSGRANALAICIAYGEEDALQELLRAGHDASALLDCGSSGSLDGGDDTWCLPIHLAICPPGPDQDSPPLPPHLACLRILVEDGKADINGLADYGLTPLHWLASSRASFDQSQAMDVLLSLGAKINARGVFGWVPLHLVTFGRHYDMAKLLVSRGASADLADGDGLTPLMHACARGSDSEWGDLAELLLRASSAETRRAVDEYNGFSAIDHLLQSNALRQSDAPLTPWQQKMIGELLRSGAPVQSSALARVLRVAAQLGSTLEAETDARGISPKTIWRAQEAMVGLAFDAYDARAAEQWVAERERRVQELEAELRALGGGGGGHGRRGGGGGGGGDRREQRHV